MQLTDNRRKIILEVDRIKAYIDALRKTFGCKIVVTIGSWDLLHIGHLRYLIKAKSFGDFLIVGTDTDRAIKLYKGELRPIIPHRERIEMLSYQSCTDIITLVDDVDEKGQWQYEIIKKICPDIFVAVEDSYPPEQQMEIKKYCKELIVLPRQAKNTSTSKKIQNIVKKTLAHKLKDIEGELP